MENDSRGVIALSGLECVLDDVCINLFVMVLL